MGGKEEKTQKPYPIRLSDNAIQNIDDITGFIAYINHQPLNAIRVGDAIYNTIERIAQNPFAFRECEEIPTKDKIYRKAVCLSWLIIYRITSAEIVIIGILYASRRTSKIKRLKKSYNYLPFSTRHSYCNFSLFQNTGYLPSNKALVQKNNDSFLFNKEKGVKMYDNV